MVHFWKIYILTTLLFINGFCLPFPLSFRKEVLLIVQKLKNTDTTIYTFAQNLKTLFDINDINIGNDDSYVPSLEEKESFKLNDQFRDTRLAAYQKLEEIKDFISLVEEYKTQHLESNLTELNLPLSIAAVKEFISSIDLYISTNKYAFILPQNSNRFISSQDSRGPMQMLTTHPQVPLGWEVFGIEEYKNGTKVALKSRGKYVSSENGRNAITCNRWNIGETELFEIIDHENDIYSLKCNNGKYLSSLTGESNYLYCDSAEIGDGERFSFISIKDLADEANISWKYYDSYFTRLFKEHRFYVDTRNALRKINCIQVDYKNVLQQINMKITELENLINQERSFLNGILWTEVDRAERIDKMLEKLAPVITFFKTAK